MNLKLYCLLLYLFTFQATAQNLFNVRAMTDSSIVTILYDLKGNIDGQLYAVELYSSHNDYSSPLLYVSGDVGKDIIPGSDKKIVWQSKELINFEGQLSFDVRAVLTFSPFIVNPSKTFSRAKRGKNYQIEWLGGIPSEQINLELYRNKKKVSAITLTNNSGTYQWEIPAKLKPVNKYQIKVSSAEKPDNATMSDTFKIGRRIPLLLKGVPVIAVVGVVTYLLTLDDKESKWLPAPEKPQ